MFLAEEFMYVPLDAFSCWSLMTVLRSQKKLMIGKMMKLIQWIKVYKFVGSL